MVYVAKITLIIVGLGLAFEGGTEWESSLPKGRAGRDLTALAIVTLMVGAFL